MTRVLFLAGRTALQDGETPSHGSGAHVLATLRQLESRFEVKAVLAEPAAAGPARLRSARRLVPARVRGVRQDLLFVRSDRHFERRALAAATAFAPDVVYERNEYFAFSGARIARSLAIPHVLEVNGLLHLDMRSFYRSFAEPLGAAAERWKLRRADAVVTVTPGLGRELALLGAPPERIAIVPNSVADDRVRTEPRPARVADDLVVGWVGHVMAWHSLDVLVDAAPAVLDVLPQTRFRIVGGGAGLARVRERVGARGLAAAFEFVGEVPFRDIASVVAEFDVGVIPAHFEFAFPVKLVEMGAAGVPVVAPGTRSLDEMLAPGVEYAPFAPGRSDDFARAVVELARDHDARARLGTALLDAVRERYSWSAVAATLGEAVEQAVALRSRSA